MVILPIPDQEVFQDVQLLPIGNRTPNALFFYIYLQSLCRNRYRAYQPNLYQCRIQSFPLISPHEIIIFKAMYICCGVLSKQTDKNNQKKKKNPKAFGIKSLQPPNQNVVNAKEVLEQSVIRFSQVQIRYIYIYIYIYYFGYLQPLLKL